MVALPAGVASAPALSDIAAAIQAAVVSLTKKKVSTPDTAFASFTCTVETVDQQSRLLLQSGTERAHSSVAVQQAPTNDTDRFSEARERRRCAVLRRARSSARPALADLVQVGDNAKMAWWFSALAPVLGSDGQAGMSEQSFADAFPRLDTVTDFSLLAVPERERRPWWAWAWRIVRTGRCRTCSTSVRWRRTTTPRTRRRPSAKLTVANSYGALYFPWVKALDPTMVVRCPRRVSPACTPVSTRPRRVEGASRHRGQPQRRGRACVGAHRRRSTAS